MTHRKKLIEVALPLEAINEGSKPETENPFLKGHPRAVHNWWARTPLSVARAVLFAQLIDDPGNDLSEEAAQKRRGELLEFVGRLATWQAGTDSSLIGQARAMIAQQFAGQPPAFWDMFAGRGSIPMEAQRLGLRVTSSDLNPVATTIQRAVLEYPQTFAGHPPVHPDAGGGLAPRHAWPGTAGQMEDIRLYGETVRQMAAHRLARFYPPGPTNEPVFAWIWARSVTCGNPACKCTVPLTRTFSFSGGDTPKWVEPVIDQKRRSISFVVRTGGSDAPRGTVNDKQAKCLVCGRRISFEHIRTEGLSGRLGVMMLAIIIKAARGVRYASPSAEQIAAATKSVPAWTPETDLPPRALGFRVQLYGMTHHRELFTQRQLLALSTISDCIRDMRDRIMHDADGDAPYADAIMTYLACALSRMTDYHCSLATWNTGNENVRCLFQRQAVPMAWDFCEANPIEGKLSFGAITEWVAGALTNLPSDCPPARVLQMDARAEPPGFSDAPVVSTDPPYFGNIGYADLSDFFYVWLRHILRDIDPQTFATLLTPKSQELIASPHRHNESKDAADLHFRSGFARVFENVRSASRGDVPATVYYAFKQQEDDAGEDERASTGWDSMLDGLVHAGYQITATWPVRTTKKARSVARGTNALASAVVIAVRQRVASAPLATRREFVSALKKELPEAIRMLQQGNIAPVDLAQASIGPGMAVFSRNSKVVESDGSAMRVRTALGIINQVLDEALAEQEGEFDADTRWALAWFGQFGMNEGPFGVAETLSKAKNTAVNALTEAGVVQAGAGRVKLRGRGELPQDWDPASDKRLSVWECVQQLIWGLEKGGDKAAAVLVAKLGAGKSEEARALAYRLYSICERKKWAKEALAYNSLVIAWPEVMKLAQSSKPAEPGELFGKE